jgi:hypothetical protein
VIDIFRWSQISVLAVRRLRQTSRVEAASFSDQVVLTIMGSGPMKDQHPLSFNRTREAHV